jgi:cold shock CspA family protein
MKYTGRVVVFKQAYGFIWCDEVGRRIFFHIADFMAPADPTIGDEVEFSLTPSRKSGFPDQAASVRVIKKAASPGAAALSSKITETEIEGVTVVRTEAI